MRATSADLPSDSFAPAEARALVAAFLGSSVPPRMVADALLLTSELVTNSVRHSGLRAPDPIGIEMMLDDRHLRVTVADTDTAFEQPPTPREGSTEGMGGWGLDLVSRIAPRWSIVRNEPNAVWFELDR